MPAEGPIAVVGAGVMGAEIALVAAQSGFDVLLRDVDRAAVDRGLAHAARTGERQVAKGRASAEDLEAALARISPVEDDAAFGRCAVAIEVVPEDMEIKRGVFRRLDAVLPPGALIASNTSGLSISALAAFTGRPEREPIKAVQMRLPAARGRIGQASLHEAPIAVLDLDPLLVAGRLFEPLLGGVLPEESDDKQGEFHGAHGAAEAARSPAIRDGRSPSTAS